MKLHTPITGKNTYCGPAAVAIITGVSTDVAADLMRQHYGKRAIRGSFGNEVGHALRQLGYGLVQHHGDRVSTLHPEGRTYAQWCRETAHERGTDTFLIAYGYHWAVIQGRRHACGMRRSLGIIRQKDAPKRRGRMTDVFKVVRLGEPLVSVQAIIDSKKASPAQRSNQKARAESKALLKVWPDISVHLEMDGPRLHSVEVRSGTCDKGDEEADPFNGDHIVSDWCEALPRIQKYVQLLQKRNAN